MSVASVTDVGRSFLFLLQIILGSFLKKTECCQTTATMPSALLILAEGAEEMETVITADVLRRGEVSQAGFPKKKL